MPKLTLTNVTSGTGLPSGVATIINANNALIEASVENSISRDGSSPNQMDADLDINDYDLLNVANLDATTATVTTLNSDTIVVEDITISGDITFIDDALSIITGPPGTPGTNGTNGVGVPVGGTTGQILAKASGTDYDTEWVTGGGGSYTNEEAQDAVGSILVDSAEIDFTYNDVTPSITASIVAGSIDETKLDASVNASLDKADSALQSSAIGVSIQAYDADLTTWAGLTPSANAQSLVTAANYAAMRALLDLEAGTDFYSVSAANAAFQPIDADLTSWASVVRASGFDTFVATPSSANLRSLLTDETGTGSAVFATSPAIATPTLTDPIITGAIKEDVYTITDGAAFEIDPGNGSIQFVTLGASRTPAATNFQDGESVILRIADGTAYTITWTTVGVVWKGGTAPTLATTGYTEVHLEKSGGVIRGVHVGDFAS